MAVADTQTPPEGEPGYFTESRSLSLSIVSILPLVVLYHVGIVQAGSSVRNLAEVWLEGPLGLVGLQAAQVLNAAIVIALAVVLWRSDRTGMPSLMVALVMILEAAFYALLLHRSGVVLAQALYDGARQVFFAIHLRPPAQLMLALGAGVYEELVFRLLLIGGLSRALQKVCLWSVPRSLAVSLVASSLLFSLVHHVGSLGEPFDGYIFVYRAVCGLLLGVVYVTRGFGVAVWTHAIYNALVIL